MPLIASSVMAERLLDSRLRGNERSLDSEATSNLPHHALVFGNEYRRCPISRLSIQSSPLVPIAWQAVTVK